MQSSTNNKRYVESFVVSKRGQTIYAPAAVSGRGTHINAAGGNVVLADGQLGWFQTSGSEAYRSLLAADTAANAPNIALFQGTSSSAAPGAQQFNAPLWNRPYEKTQTIASRNSIIATKQSYKPGTFSVQVIKNITALPLTTFGYRIAFRGRVAQEFFSSQEAMNLNVQWTTPAYTTTQLATAAPVSEIINNLVYDTLRNSQALTTSIRNRGGAWPVIGLAINTAGGAGTLISALTAGTSYNVVTTATGARSVSFTAEQITSIQAAATAAGLASTSTVEIVSVASPVAADAIILIGLDRIPAYKDYDPLFKTRLEIALTYGFNPMSTYLLEGSKAAEAQGSGLQLALKYKFTQGQRKYNLIDVTDPVVEFPNPFDTTETYDVLSIMHETVATVDTNHTIVSPMVEYICVPTATKGVAGAAAMYTSVTSRLDTWLTSAGQPVAQVF